MPRPVIAVLAALLVVLASACGGGSSTSASAETPEFPSNANCQQLTKLDASLARVLTPVSGGTVDPEKYADAMNQLADAAPSDIRSDFKTFATAYGSFVKALRASGYVAGSGKVPTASQLKQVTGAAKRLATPQAKAAEEHLTSWASQNCMSR